nr:acetyl-CoA carboxylase biotin carboxylase subunit [Actinoallomurus sp.]
MFGTVLIANRGEIALRVARTCRLLGIRTVAVFSTEDADSPVVRMADQAVRIGPANPRRSYLNIPAIIEAARQTGADAIHPGYGFLSENPDFAEVCAANGFTFIGPSADLMATLGDKSSARALMAETGLPLLPGSIEPVASVDAALSLASEIGYPVIVKAVAGGGGRGMGVANDPAELREVYARNRSAAQMLFGDGRVYLERFCARARHVEVQVLGDGRGNAVHLGERDCSVQRRHQKLIEESPAVGLSRELREEICAAATRATAAVGYSGAGTFEFLVDDAGWYFMEVNCRIQVEHPVTEMITGVDLVREQLRIAAGEPLGLAQEDIEFRGAAVECRVNAEDPRRDFFPAPGRLDEFRVPGGPFVRVDTYGYAGGKVAPSYDSLLAKVVTWGSDRAEAIGRMDVALEEFLVEGPGIATTAPFLRQVLADSRFRDGVHTTGLVAAMTATAPAA